MRQHRPWHPVRQDHLHGPTKLEASGGVLGNNGIFTLFATDSRFSIFHDRKSAETIPYLLTHDFWME
jgi:hypothetical protein